MNFALAYLDQAHRIKVSMLPFTSLSSPSRIISYHFSDFIQFISLKVSSIYNQNLVPEEFQSFLPPSRHETPKKHSDRTYEEFIKNKSEAFLFYSKHQSTAVFFPRFEAVEAERLRQARRRVLSLVYFGTCFLGLVGDRYLQQKFLLYGMTHGNGRLKILFKMWIIPTAITSLCSETYGEWRYGKKIQEIANQYEFLGPEFERAYIEKCEQLNRK